MKNESLNRAAKTKSKEAAALAQRLQKIVAPSSPGVRVGKTSFETGSANLKKVFVAAAAGDSEAARDLIRLATIAAELTERLFHRRAKLVKSVVLDAVNYPTLHTLDQFVAGQRQKILNELPLRDSPFKRRNHRENDHVYRFIAEIAYPMLEEYRVQGIRIRSLDGSAQRIPVLTRKTAKVWAAIAAGYFFPLAVAATKGGEAWAAPVTGVRRKLGQKNNRMLSLMAARLAMPNIASASAAKALIDDLQEQGRLTVVAATREFCRLKKLDQREATEADLLRGIRETLAVKLESLLVR